MKKILNSKYGGEFLFVQDIDSRIVNNVRTLLFSDWGKYSNHPTRCKPYYLDETDFVYGRVSSLFSNLDAE